MRPELSLPTRGRHRRPVLVYAVTVGRSARTNLRGQLAHLRGRGYRVILMCTPDDEARSYVDEEGVEMIPLPMRRGYPTTGDILAFFRAVSVFRRVRPALVCTATPKAGLVIGLASLVSGTPARVYSLTGLRLEGERPGSLRYHLLCLAEYVSCRAAHVVVLPGESVRRRAISLGLVRPDRARVLGRGSANGVDLTRFRPATDDRRRAARARHGLPPHSVVFGFVGRVVLDKGIDTLVEAFRSLPRPPPAELLLVGGFESECRMPRALRATILDDPRIHLTGFVRETSPWYEIMDAVVLPSRREGLSTVLLEAAAAGLPTITTDATGCGDGIEDGVTGITVPVDDSAGLARAMAALADDPRGREQMGRAGRTFVERHFDQSVVWANTAEFVDVLLRERT